jgi:Protein of unknown function (DUF1524)
LTEVRYQEHGDNQVLRHVLRLVWDQQCYWCRQFKDFLELEIDHILPSTSEEDARLRLKQTFGLRDDYDVHALYNLAPICGACNRTKSNVDLTEKGLVLSILRKARMLVPEVTRRVVAFRNPSKLAGALLEAAVADLSDTSTRETFEQGAPAVVQKLAELGEGKADFFVFRTEEVEVGDELQRIGLRLNERGRGAVAVLGSVAGGRLEEALSAPLSDLLNRVASEATYAFERSEDMGRPGVAEVSIIWSEITIDRFEFESTPPAQLKFEFAGKFEAEGSTTIARDNMLGGERECVQGDATVGGRFTFGFSRTPNDPVGQFEFDEVLLEDWQADLEVDGGS